MHKHTGEKSYTDSNMRMKKQNTTALKIVLLCLKGATKTSNL